jgi:hypothetical protein
VFKFFFGENHILDAGFAYNAMGETLYQEPYTNKNYKAMQWLYYHGDFGNSGLSVLFLNNGLPFDSDPDTASYKEKVAYSQTFGARYTYKGSKVKADGAFYYQGGKNGSNTDLQAFYFTANVYIQATSWFNIGLGGEYLSGTSTVNQKLPGRTDQSFNPFYGTNHKFNGLMDYFYVGNYNGQNGLIDLYLPLRFTVKKWFFSLAPHYFMAAATVSSFDVNNQLVQDFSDPLGTEIDFVFGYTFSKNLHIRGGYSQMFATETMQVVKYPDNPAGEYYQNTNNWAWLMLTFKPTFWDSTNKRSSN